MGVHTYFDSYGCLHLYVDIKIINNRVHCFQRLAYLLTECSTRGNTLGKKINLFHIILSYLIYKKWKVRILPLNLSVSMVLSLFFSIYIFLCLFISFSYICFSIHIYEYISKDIHIYILLWNIHILFCCLTHLSALRVKDLPIFPFGQQPSLWFCLQAESSK